MSRAAPALPAVQARVWRAVMLRVQLNAHGGTRVRSAERAQRHERSRVAARQAASDRAFDNFGTLIVWMPTLDTWSGAVTTALTRTITRTAI
jgi:hypothetical protein